MTHVQAFYSEDTLAEYLKTKAGQLNIVVDDEETGKLLLYMELLVSYNKKVNLTAISDHKEIILKHFIDSLTALKYINGKKIIDVGTGAGFPGLPLKIMDNKINLTLLDSLSKRITFLNDVISRLNLHNAACVNSRAEDAGASSLYRESFDMAVSRAVAPLSVLSEYCLPFVKIGGFFLAMKGGDINSELEEAKNAIGILGGEMYKTEQLCLDNREHNRTLVLIKKVEETPPKYPRRNGKPVRYPIK